MSATVCMHCGRQVVRETCEGGHIWRADDGTSWCDAREPWKRHRLHPTDWVDPTQVKAAPKVKPEEVPAPARIEGYDPKKCRRPDKQVLTRADAKVEARRMRLRGHHDVLAYECTCKGWHVGNSRDHFTKRLKRALGMRPSKKRITR